MKNEISSIYWEARPAPEKWSRKEVLVHLTDSVQINLERFVRCTYKENYKLVYSQNEWVALNITIKQILKEILDLWLLLNRQIVRVLADYPPDRLHITSNTGVYTVQLNTIEFLAAGYIRHMQHHLNQIIVISQ